MRNVMIVLVAATVSLSPAAQAQTTPDSENGRYSFSTVPDGTLHQPVLCARGGHHDIRRLTGQPRVVRQRNDSPVRPIGGRRDIVSNISDATSCWDEGSMPRDCRFRAPG